MRAKNEFRLISEAYDIKLLAEKAVDGTLMCSKDCCGSPVMECKCGDDCPHCNCFMIQKAVKDFGLKSPLLEGIVPEDERDEPIRNRDDYDAELPAGHYDTHVRLQRGGRWNAHTVNVRKTDKELIQKFLDQGFRIVKPFDEDNEEKQKGVDGKACWKGYRREGTKMKGGKRVDNCVKVEDEESNKNREFADSLWSKDPEDLARRRRAAERVLGKRRNPRPAHLFTKEGSWRAKEDSEDNEGEALQPKVGISGYEHKPDAMVIAHRELMARLRELDLNEWEDYIKNNPRTGVDDIMKKVHKQFKQSPPSRYSRDYDIVWKNKVRPWLKEHKGKLRNEL